MNSLNIVSKYDSDLCRFQSFKIRPFSLPHIGSRFTEPGVLFLMESHYIDPDFFKYQYDKENLIPERPELFYNVGAEGLTQDFKKYLNTRQIIKDAEHTDKTLRKGKSVYRKLSSAVREGLELSIGEDASPLDYVAIYNYFQRPSYKPSASIKLCSEDEQVAYEALNHIVQTAVINKIIFTSSKAYDSFIKVDNANKSVMQGNRKIYRAAHPRVWGNECPYVKGISWRQWIIDRLANNN